MTSRSPKSSRETCDVELSGLIAPSFYALHRDVQAHGHTHYLLFGGRGSCKSTFAAIEILLLIKKNPRCHALVLRKIAATVRDSVYSQYIWAAEILGVAHEFEQKLSPPELVYKATGQRILFRGADDRAKIKSLKMPFGYIGITHFEEKDQFDSRAELRTILQSTMRGGDVFWNFETCNPPQRPAHWANRDALISRSDRAIHRSDYRSVPIAWLGEQFFAEAEMLKKQSEVEYRHEYLGEAVGLGASVFMNVSVEKISEELKNQFDHIYMGCDWGYFPDPFVFIKAHYDAARRVLYIFDEICANRKSNAETAALCKAKGAGLTCTLWADSAEPKSISDFKSSGILCRAAGKGAGSVPYSMKWLASLTKIVIDPAACPESAREFALYEHLRDKEGGITEGYPDRDNHCIDAVRYALYPVWRRKGQ
ncbi:MAG: PBSX family phage terminase large subunit [Clostridia bacterium]|nr:PBSX family phage terminase large subunit [Clostridia bacterium]